MNACLYDYTVPQWLDAAAYLEFGLGEGDSGVESASYRRQNKSKLMNITVFKVADISPIKVNGNNKIKIHVIETLFTRYLLTELIFVYFIFQTYTVMLCNKPDCIFEKELLLY